MRRIADERRSVAPGSLLRQSLQIDVPEATGKRPQSGYGLVYKDVMAGEIRSRASRRSTYPFFHLPG